MSLPLYPEEEVVISTGNLRKMESLCGFTSGMQSLQQSIHESPLSKRNSILSIIGSEQNRTSMHIKSNFEAKSSFSKLPDDSLRGYSRNQTDYNHKGLSGSTFESLDLAVQLLGQSQLEDIEYLRKITIPLDKYTSRVDQAFFINDQEVMLHKGVLTEQQASLNLNSFFGL